MTQQHPVNQGCTYECDASRRGKTTLYFFSDKNHGSHRSGEAGGGRLLCDPGSELLLGGSG